MSHSAAEGSVLQATTTLISSVDLRFQTGAPVVLYVLRDGAIVAGTGMVFGVGRDYELLAGRPAPGPEGTLGLTQCHSVGTSDDEAPALPPGNYQVIGVLEDVTPGHPSPRLVTDPARLQIRARG
jgi:hypothetical protein